MHRDLLAKRSCRLPVSVRLGLSLALGMLAVPLLASLLAVASPPLAQTAPPNPGDLDTTFGTTGIVTTPVSPYGSKANDVVIQEDGKIVVVGYAHSGSDYDFAVVRYTISGTLDTTLGTSGIVTTPVSAGTDVAYGVAIQPDGKIVAAGVASKDFAVVRYTVSGTLDTDFGTNGVVTTPIGPGDDYVNGVAIQKDGKIVAAGDARSSGSHLDTVVVRYTVSGTLDPTFGTGGIVTIPSDWPLSASDVAIQKDGKIVAAGDAHSGSDYDFVLARYTVSGTLDTTFGTSGVVTTAIGPGDDEAFAVAIQEDGKIVAAGYARNGSRDDVAVVRYHTGPSTIYVPLVLRNA